MGESGWLLNDEDKGSGTLSVRPPLEGARIIRIELE